MAKETSKIQLQTSGCRCCCTARLYLRVGMKVWGGYKARTLRMVWIETMRKSLKVSIKDAKVLKTIGPGWGAAITLDTIITSIR